MGDTTKRDFKDFRVRLKRDRAPIDVRRAYYRRYGAHTGDPVREDFTLDEILQIIRSGDLQSLRQLSRYYYRVNGSYRNNIDFLAHLPLYETVVIPVFQEGKGSQAQITKAFYAACDFIDKMDLANTLARITTFWLINGIYNGIVRTFENKVVIQDLPIQYCRTRFKDFNNLNILEFDLRYFDTIRDPELQRQAVQSFPEVVQKAWKAWIRGNKKDDSWVVIPAAAGGVSFTFAHDQTPQLIASIAELKKLDNAIGREEKRDQNELYKLLIERMPINSNGQLVFQLDEVADIHASVADMLSDIDTVDVLTTFGEADLESLQDTTAASQSADRIEKYKKNAWDALGRGELLFNPTNSSSLAYAIKKDQTLMNAYLNVYETWIKFILNDRFARKGLLFDFEILPLTVFNRSDMQQTYFRGAQYGYPKMFAGVAMGIKQRDLLSLMNFENEFLEMSTKMVPLQSSYTTSGNVIASEEKNSSSNVKTTTVRKQAQDLTNTGGRSQLPDEQKSEKTQANRQSLG